MPVRALKGCAVPGPALPDARDRHYGSWLCGLEHHEGDCQKVFGPCGLGNPDLSDFEGSCGLAGEDPV